MAFDSKLLDGIVIFNEVINSGSFTQASLNSGHSTSYISKEINKLEARLGIRLMHRTTRSISLTPEGEFYHQQCGQIIDDAKTAQNQLFSHQQEPQGTLKVGCGVSLGLSRLRPVLPEFMARYPKVDVELELNDRKVDVVADGFDIVIRASREMEDSSLISRKVMTSASVTIASPLYIKKYGRPKTPEDLQHHPSISYSNIKQPNVWQYMQQDGTTVNVNVKSRLITNSPEMELALCLAGQGVTRLPRFNIEEELSSGQLIDLFPDLPGIDIGVYLVYASRKHMSSRVRHFIDFIIEKMGV